LLSLLYPAHTTAPYPFAIAMPPPTESTPPPPPTSSHFPPPPMPSSLLHSSTARMRTCTTAQSVKRRDSYPSSVTSCCHSSYHDSDRPCYSRLRPPLLTSTIISAIHHHPHSGALGGAVQSMTCRNTHRHVCRSTWQHYAIHRDTLRHYATHATHRHYCRSRPQHTVTTHRARFWRGGRRGGGHERCTQK
jgi:hypothetical protein